MLKVPLTITGAVLGCALTVGLVIIQQNWVQQRAALESQTLLLAQITAASAPQAIMRGDVWSLYRSLKQASGRSASAAGESSIAEAAFLDPAGNVLAHTDLVGHPLGRPLGAANQTEAQLVKHVPGSARAHVMPKDQSAPGFVDAVIPISMDNTIIGFLLLRASTDALQAQLRRDAMVILGVAIGLALVGSALGALVSLRMVSPLKALRDGLDKVARGDPESARPVRRRARPRGQQPAGRNAQLR